MEKLTLQEIFNRNWQHFVVEGNPPATGFRTETGQMCYYRSPEGRKCAVGLAIPDNLYTGVMERCSVWDLQKGSVENVLISPDDDRKLSQFARMIEHIDVIALSSIQTIHDNIAEKEAPEAYKDAFRSQLTNFAQEYNLTVPA